MDVHHCFCGRLRGAVRKNMVSSTPTASTAPIRSSSASNRAAPQRMTSLLTVCQSQPSSLATADTVRPSRPTISAAHRPARQVNNPRSGAIRGSCSVNEPAPQPRSGHSRRCFRHARRTRRPNAGRSTSSTSLSPFDHTRPPHPGHDGRDSPTVRTSTSRAPSRGSLTSSISTSPNPTITSHMRLCLHSTGVLLSREVISASDYGGPHPRSRGFPTPSQPTTPPSVPKSRLTRGFGGAASTAGPMASPGE